MPADPVSAGSRSFSPEIGGSEGGIPTIQPHFRGFSVECERKKAGMTPSLSLNSPKLDLKQIELVANTIRGLAMDATRAANSGHPGLPMGMAESAAVLWLHFLKYSPNNPAWPDRDRFVLSAGHGSMLLYSLLHLAGYNLPIDEIRAFRQWGSMTPGHPEHGLTPGVETTTGPLGQGFTNGVGMGLAAHMLEARFNSPERRLVDHWIYAIVSDGDLMEGVASEAASFAGHHRLGRLIYLYDDNHISIEGSTDLTFSREDVQKRFKAYGWHVQRADNAEPQSVADAIAAAQAVPDQPHLIIVKSIIGYPSPKANTAGVHGSPLSEDEIAETKKRMGWPVEERFHIPEAVRETFEARRRHNESLERRWNALLEKTRNEQPEVAALWDVHLNQTIPGDGRLAEVLPTFDPAEKPLASRAASGKTINALAPELPWLVGGSADLAPSNNTMIKGADAVGPGQFEGRNLHFGVREHAMGGILNGMALHGGFRPYGGTFLVFADYMRPAIRLAALMEQPVIYVFTHDSIFLGEDGPTHQPIEQLASLRAIPGLTVLRPADAAETAQAWRLALQKKDGPTALVLTRQGLPTLDRAGKGLAPAADIARGGYVLSDDPGGEPELILIASGSEVAVALEAAEDLRANGRRVRVVDLASWELFALQSAEYRESVLPSSCRKRLAVEAGSPFGWERWVGEKGRVVGMARFGASAPAKVLAEQFGFTKRNLAAAAEALLNTPA